MMVKLAKSKVKENLNVPNQGADLPKRAEIMKQIREDWGTPIHTEEDLEAYKERQKKEKNEKEY